MSGYQDGLGGDTDLVGPGFDVFLYGTVFLDIIFTGLESLPSTGTETWAAGMGSCPGGIANLAIATSRLGLRTALAAAFGDDDYADFCWRTLAEQEHVDLVHSRKFEQWHSPVTVSMASAGDRAMVSHGHDAPVPATQMIGKPPRSRAVIVDLAQPERIGDAYHTSLLRRYGFLDDLLPSSPGHTVRRAAATIARYADVGGATPMSIATKSSKPARLTALEQRSMS